MAAGRSGYLWAIRCELCVLSVLLEQVLGVPNRFRTEFEVSHRQKYHCIPEIPIDGAENAYFWDDDIVEQNFGLPAVQTDGVSFGEPILL